MRVCIIGGGVSGCMAGIMARNNPDNEVTIFEGNEKLLKKMFITGKGRCNLTNFVDFKEFLDNVVTNPKFLYSSLSDFDSYSTYGYFEELGVPLKIEHGNRVFPQSDKSSDITRAFEKKVLSCGVKVNLKTLVNKITKTKEVFKVSTSLGDFDFDKVIVATGGASYKATGSTGDGYMFAKKFGHKIVDIKPGLVGIKTQEKFVSDLSGLTLKNINLSCYDNGKKVYGKFGELLFTHVGISGPTVLSLSSVINRLDFSKLRIEIDLKPALDEEKLDKRIQADFEKNSNKAYKNALSDLLPRSLIPIIIKRSKISENKQVNQITSEEREKLVSSLKKFILTPKELCDLDGAIITSGGVDILEVNPKTMESKMCKGLYFIGEVLDVDAVTGGFNMQIALCTGHSAGKHINK